MGRLVEFFEGEDSRLSMTRLMLAASFLPASYIAVATLNENIFMAYVGAYVIGYIGGKGADMFSQRKWSGNVDNPD